MQIKSVYAKDVLPGMITAFGGFLWMVKENQPQDPKQPPYLSGFTMLITPVGDAHGRFKDLRVNHQARHKITVRQHA